MPYFVVGGEYRDTAFREIVRADPPQGPFGDYQAALTAWRSKSIRRIDEAYVRYRIVEAERAEGAAVVSAVGGRTTPAPADGRSVQARAAS